MQVAYFTGGRWSRPAEAALFIALMATQRWMAIPLYIVYPRHRREFSATRTRWRTIAMLFSWAWGTTGTVIVDLFIQPPKMAIKVHLFTWHCIMLSG